MKNNFVKNMICAFAVLSIACISLIPAFAQSSIDKSVEKGSLTVELTYEDEPVLGGEFTLYHVAKLVEKDSSYAYEFTDNFEKCNLNINDLNDKDLPKALWNFIKLNGIDGVSKRVNNNSKSEFNNIESGLYLAVQTKNSDGFKIAAPFLAEVPLYNPQSNKWEYNAEAFPKLEPDDVTITTTQPEEPITMPSDRLPHTGQLNWPVPVLAFAGMVLIILGIVMYNGGKKR